MSWISIVVGTVATALVAQGVSGVVWARVGARLGLSLDRVWPAPPRLSGTLRGFVVVVTRALPRIAVQIHGVDPWFTLERDNAVAQATEPDIEVGDWGFDQVIRVRGDRDFALSLLDEETRRAAERVVLELDGRVADGMIEVPVQGIQSMPFVLHAMLDLANRLRRPTTEELPPLLARNARDDPSSGLRLRAFRNLVREFSDAPEVLPLARAFLGEKNKLGEKDEELRFEAACFLATGDEKEKTRRRAADELSRLAKRRDLAPDLRRRALEALARSDHSRQATILAASILRDRHQPREVRRASLLALERARAIEKLLEVETFGDATEASILARALGLCGDVAAQPRLLELLDQLNEGVRMATIEALGTIGNVRAVGPLRRAAGEKEFITSDLARAVEEAVLQIQARAGGSQAGEISIVATEPLEGAVSVAHDEPDIPEGGEVSLTE